MGCYRKRKGVTVGNPYKCLGDQAFPGPVFQRTKERGISKNYKEVNGLEN